ncbi:ABC transporter permease [Flavobacterium sp. LS1R47]|uniref:ABC transporter permease n=1 Tax=Flavobacterium frigoritolerans TaxID=2987686 RepID=A0A9X2ZMU0_9FLAO|nr:ABC transporter permease [Flavobacterium frigoritolerans]MCV9933680.1 ABC transporter permease [Flavobacterium frigoritolerans]
MIFNWIKIFVYHLKQNKLFSFLNVLGLSIGIAGVIFAILYWNNENSYDQWNPEKENVYQVLNSIGGATENIWNSSPVPFGVTCKATIPEIENITFFDSWYYEDILKYNNQKWMGKKIIVADYDFFEIFPFPIVKGAKKDILKEKNSVAISEDEAKVVFKNEDPIGKTIVNDGNVFIVKAVYKIMRPSSVEPNYVFGGLLKEYDMNNWGNFNHSLCIKVKKGTDAANVLKKMQHVDFVNRTMKDAKENGQTVEQYVKENGVITVILDQLKEARLYGIGSKVGGSYPEGRGDLQLLYIMVGLSGLILALSLVNYINLATASAIKRAKEVGVRKIVGANKSQIIWQFIFETAIIVVLAILLALAIVELSLPFFNDFLGKTLVVKGAEFYLQIIIVFIVVIVLAGIFPAVYVANFETLKVLRGNFSRSKSGIWIRNSMLIFQFTIAAFFIIGALVVYSQVSYMMNKDLGFSGNQVISISFNYKDREKRLEKYFTTREELMKITGVEHVSTFAGSFGQGANSSSGFKHNGVFVQPQNVTMDFGFLEMMKIKMSQGRDLSPQYASDTINNWLINETCAKMLNLKNPINTVISSGWGNKDGNLKFKIVGVVKDFHILGFKNKVPPMVFVNVKTLKWDNLENIYVKVSPENLTETLSKLETYWQKNINPDYPFNYQFVDKAFAKTYNEQIKQKNLFFVLNVIVIIIAIFGLFALASFSMERRLKEIAIRKTLGAETDALLKELSKQYVLFCLIGFVIGIFPAYFLLNKWLENFAFRVDVSFLPFFIALVVLLLLTLVIVLAKAYQITKIDILKYLKYE